MKTNQANLSFCNSSCDCPELFVCYQYSRGLGVCVQENKSALVDKEQEESPHKDYI